MQHIYLQQNNRWYKVYCPLIDIKTLSTKSVKVDKIKNEKATPENDFPNRKVHLMQTHCSLAFSLPSTKIVSNPAPDQNNKINMRSI